VINLRKITKEYVKTKVTIKINTISRTIKTLEFINEKRFQQKGLIEGQKSLKFFFFLPRAKSKNKKENKKEK